ncbi:barstar family protein [Xanthomonas arboricola]|uniref:barstar family protein n=1 Tax=Xanthomonas arboricola TaxID=56448 RepID=UPI001859484E|nr:barstar family protein [Xanthomonas arboricola]MBB3759189.1 RNAse (barnase) inhibitor barstar [Xanthomonas arboricola]
MLKAQNTVRIDGRQITDKPSFHDVFSAAFGFPDFYGRNYDAWIDCLTHLDASTEEAMTRVRVLPGELLILYVDHAEAMRHVCPEVLQFLLEATAFVNFRRMDRGLPAVLVLALNC